MRSVLLNVGVAAYAAALLTSGCGGGPTAPSAVPPSGWLGLSAPLPTSDPRFNADFYQQLVRGTLESSTPFSPRRLASPPSIYLQRSGLSDAFVADVERRIRAEVPAFTGGALTVARWETGLEARPESEGWIVIELRTDEAVNCGMSKVGASAGHIWINTASKCARRGEPTGPASLFAHEVGHALGFFHVDAGLMQADVPMDQELTDRERYHGAVAYGRVSS